MNFPKILNAVNEKRTFFWEYSETKGYVLHGRLPWRKNAKKITCSRDWKKAEKASFWIGNLLCYNGRWQQLALLINKHEIPVPLRPRPKPKRDTMTLDLFATVEGGK
jgi:hypothetical protein